MTGGTMIATEKDLRLLYAPAKERAVKKQLTSLDHHCKRFVALSPFVVLATSDAEGNMDASPRGGEPGFVKVVDDHTLILPDWSGNNRLDTFGNLGIGTSFPFSAAGYGAVTINGTTGSIVSLYANGADVIVYGILNPGNIDALPGQSYYDMVKEGYLEHGAPVSQLREAVEFIKSNPKEFMYEYQQY